MDFHFDYSETTTVILYLITVINVLRFLTKITTKVKLIL